MKYPAGSNLSQINQIIVCEILLKTMQICGFRFFFWNSYRRMNNDWIDFEKLRNRFWKIKKFIESILKTSEKNTSRMRLPVAAWTIMANVSRSAKPKMKKTKFGSRRNRCKSWWNFEKKIEIDAILMGLNKKPWKFRRFWKKYFFFNSSDTPLRTS